MNRYRWEYSFALHTCNLSNHTKAYTNPFTRERIDVPLDEGLTPDECQAVLRVFNERMMVGPAPEFEGHVLYLPDHQSIRFRGFDDEQVYPINTFAVDMVVKSLTREALSLVMDVARAGNMALMDSIGKSVRLVSQPMNPLVHQRWPNAQSITSEEVLKSWLQTDIGGQRVRVFSA